ncbi:hypothetical protein DSL72_004552 [Monilinia vaccinii-corymbosi]|uniref:Tyrosinase copper-binding domain-containing protein n=1 Tax=Monilinia vaccinii-corymbosi TaxID=61207 RepID=A0A8A3P2H8_9HELO|nr:hypothetical protein DSL72_004552 [Monilinia vaccinii-corymbosi]
MLFGRATTRPGLAILLLAFVVLVEASYYPIGGVHTGVNKQTGERPARRDILDLQNDVPTWFGRRTEVNHKSPLLNRRLNLSRSLYIQALTAIQKVKEDDPLSWFQIAGIHGRPYYSWGHVEQSPNAPLIGYCTHANVLFPTWHRPYLALYEQALAAHVQEIADQYNDDAYSTAADNFRIPYWDWASIPTLPSIVTDATVEIETPYGTQNVDNPLLLYRFQQFPLNATWFPTRGASRADEDLAQDPTTLRYPDREVRGTSQPDVADEHLDSEGLMSSIYSMFAKSKAYYNMATQVSPGPSLENPHGAVHVDVGGSHGHMSQLSYAGFDPIFWLHHANVDRLFTMWQAIYPDQWISPENDMIGTFTIPAGSTDTSATPLTPFYQGDGETPWTSDAARYTSTFGYSYDAVPDATITNATELSSNVTATVNSLYNPQGTFTGSKRKRAEQREWSVAVQVSSTALGERFVVRLHNGGSRHIASFHVLPPPVADGGSMTHLTYHHEFSLRDAIKTVDNGNTEEVVLYLKNNLSWSVETRNGTVVPAEDVEGLIVCVHDEIVTHPVDKKEFPVYGEKTLHPEITSGKAGGASSYQ